MVDLDPWIKRLLSCLVVLLGLVAVGLAAGPASADDSTPLLHGVLTAGAEHTCAVLAEGNVRCWGSGADGRLGYGTDKSVGDGAGPSVEEAGDVSVGGPVAAVTAGDAHTCALLLSGDVRCWGDGKPFATVPLAQKATVIAAGARHSCAVLADGTVACWTAGSKPTVVPGIADATAISAGGRQTCAVTAESVRCWKVGGAATSVSLPSDDAAVDVAVGGAHACAVLGSGQLDCWSLPAETPQPIELAAAAVGVAAAGDRTCAVLDGGAVQCWEAGGSPDGVAVAGGVTALAAGPAHTCALVGSDLDCWGDGSDGRLGYGDTRSRTAPAVALAATEPVAATGSAKGRTVTFGGGSQADGSRPAAPVEPGGTPWGWIAAGVGLAAAVGAGSWRLRRCTAGGGEGLPKVS